MHGNKKNQQQEKKVILVDFENLPNSELPAVKGEREIYVFVGRNQKKVPIEVVVAMQKLGNQAHWVTISGSGKNNLDFHLCFVMGQLHETQARNTTFFVLSKDKGFDSVVNYVSTLGRKCYRIERAEQANNPKTIPRDPKVPDKPLPPDPVIKPILERLKRHKAQARPRKLRTFRNFLTANFKEITEKTDPEELIRKLRSSGRVYEDNGKMVYRL